MFKWFFSLTVLGLSLASGGAHGAAPEAHLLTLDARQQAALGVRTAPLQAARNEVLLASAQVSALPGREVTVAAPYPGLVSRWLVGVGDAVGVGTRLAQFTSPMLGEARRQWDEARLTARQAQAALQRDQAMLDEGIIPAVRLQLTQSRHEAAQAALHAREAELQAAGLRLDGDGGYASGTLLSPLQGRVVQTSATVGQRVEAGAVLLRLVDDRGLQLELDLSPEKAARVRVGDAVTLDTRQARAVITGVSPALQAGQMARARARVTERGQLLLGEVLPASIQASGWRSAEAAWRIPARALSPWRGQSVVFVAQATGFRAEPVTVLSSNDDVAVVQGAGLAEGQSVAVGGVAALRAWLQQKDE